MPMNKETLINEVAKDLGKTRSEVSSVVANFFHQIRTALRRGEQVKLHSLINFRIVTLKATRRRNPNTGAVVDTPEKRVIRAKCGSAFNL